MQRKPTNIKTMIRVNCFIKLKDGQREELLENAKKLTEASVKDEGNIAYDIFASATRKDVFLVCETWESEASLKKHMEADHFKLYVGNMEKLADMKIETFEF